MEKTVRDRLLGVLEDLGEKFQTFKSKLSEIQLQEGYGAIPWSTLQRADPRDLTEELLSCFKDHKGVEVTVKVLRAINQQNLAERLTKTTGSDGLNLDHEAKTHQDQELGEEELFKERRALQVILSKLKMEQHRSIKLGLRDLQEINPENLQNRAPQTLEDLPWHFLRQVLALNGIARNTCLGQEELPDQASSEENGEQGDGGNILYHSNTKTTASVNYLDVLCIVLLCSDSFLQQEILAKMSMCQFALPLLLPPLDTPKCTLMLWAMRDIVKKWRPHSLAESRGFIEESLVLTKMPTISFVRMGNCNFSKSQLLNEVLSPSQQHHDFFIHQDTESGNIPREIADGLVEIFWYFPTGREDSDLFPEPVAITNLHGDIESHWLQFTFLTEISSAVFVVTESIGERDYALLSSLQGSATEYYFILCSQAEKHSETMDIFNKLPSVLKLSQLNVLEKSSSTNKREFIGILQGIIQSIMNSSKKRVNMEAMAMTARGLGIQVDEDCEECQNGSTWAREITMTVRDVANFKGEMLKLQGALWNNLTKVEKEFCRMKEQGDVSPEDYKIHLKEKLLELHAQQNNCELNYELIKFINGLEQLTSVGKHYFLKWLKLTLDHIVKSEHSRLQDQCNAFSSDTQKLEKLDESISLTSLGMQHFLRELGQFYQAECSIVKEDKTAVIQRKYIHFPRLAADLMLEGFPMELMDGDASNIPLQWVTDVMMELHTKLEGRSRMLVLTILGLQSTGKSTLLNTMFGLQFAVSSGQCTRGAFMMLIKVAENFQEELGCDFILVIDTEGLKAPELAKVKDIYEHNNELATLVVGLSDITIINLAMENTKMKDVLQIVVHAFLRIKETGHKPLCLFIHQTISDVTELEQSMEDRKHLLKQLDEMVKAAAKMEGLKKEVTFSDIMNYDPERQDWYIPSLWRGVPPMAPVNARYSESVGNLKKHLLELIRIHSAEIIAKIIPQFTEWVKSLWNALKHENFCFSFRNPLATTAYNKLSVKYCELEWEFQKNMYVWLSEQETLIQNQDADELDCETFTKLSQETQQKLQHEEDKIFECLEKYMEAEKSSLNTIELNDFIRSTRTVTSTFNSHSHRLLERAMNRPKHRYYNNESEFKKIIEQEVARLLEEFRSQECKPTDEELEQKFQTMWREVLSESMLFSSIKRPIYQEMQRLLEKDLGNRGRLEHQKPGSLLHYAISSFRMKKEYLDSSWFKTLKELFTKKSWNKTQELATSIMHQCLAYIDEKAHSKADYDEIYCRELLHMINERLQQEDVLELHTSDCFEVDLKLHILGEAARVFQEIHDNFMQESDSQQSLKNLKPQYFSLLKDLFFGKEVSHKRARDFCDKCLKPALSDYMNKRLGIVIADDILRSGQTIDYASRGFFQFATQKKLLEENDFYSYVKYIKNYEDFVKTRIQTHLCDHYSKNEVLEDLEREILSTVITKVRGALENFEDQTTTASAFIDNFCKVLKKDLVISKDSLVGIWFINTVNTGKFTAFIQTFLSDLEEQILAEFKNLEIKSKLSHLSVKPQDEIFKRVFGCGKQCPFCKVPCDAGVTDHKEHFALVHRPKGLGMYRFVETNMLVYELCSSSVVSNSMFQCKETQWESHPFKDYHTIFPDWHIQPDPSINTSDYWKFVFKEFNQQFAEEYEAKPADLPGDWEKITKEQALQSLGEAFQMK